MFKFVAIFALISIAAAGVQRTSPPYYPPNPVHSTHTGSAEDVHAEIIKRISDVREDGFDYALDTSNGIHAVASGDVHGNIHGEYHWQSSDGVPVKITYVADENGYQPSGELLPTPPPTPEAILKALAYLEAHAGHEEPRYGKH